MKTQLSIQERLKTLYSIFFATMLNTAVLLPAYLPPIACSIPNPYNRIPYSRRISAIRRPPSHRASTCRHRFSPCKLCRQWQQPRIRHCPAQYEKRPHKKMERNKLCFHPFIWPYTRVSLIVLQIDRITSVCQNSITCHPECNPLRRSFPSVPGRHCDTCNHRVQNRQDHKETDSRIQKHIDDIKAEVQKYRINDIVLPLQKQVHKNCQGSDHHNIG